MSRRGRSCGRSRGPRAERACDGGGDCDEMVSLAKAAEPVVHPLICPLRACEVSDGFCVQIKLLAEGRVLQGGRVGALSERAQTRAVLTSG